MKIKINYQSNAETLTHIGNRLFTKEQVEEIRNV